MKTAICWLLAACMLLFTSACTNTKEKTKMDSNTYAIEANAALHLGDLSIGVAGLRQNQSYVDAITKQTLTGPTAGLWLGIKDKPELARSLTIYRGLNMKYQGHILEIIDITAKEVIIKVEGSN